MRWRRGGLPLGGCVGAALLLAAPAPAPAAHDGGNSCYECHSLDARESDAGTSFINKLSRTFESIKLYDGLPDTQAPERLGCLYCHFTMTSPSGKMKPVLGHFQGRTSMHPVGFDFRGAGTNTNNEFLSTLGSARDFEIDCVDCHDLVNQGDGSDDTATLEVHEGADGDPTTSAGGREDKYPEHGPPVDPLNNPFMLRGVTAAREFDVLCRGCHDSAAPRTVKGVSLQLLSHADGAAGRPLRENDGTVLRTADLDGDGVPDTAGLAQTAQCTVCHDTHYSANRRLLNDGHEGHKTAAGVVADTPVTGSNCTGICHYPGDAGNSYLTRGHGMAAGTYAYSAGQPAAGGTRRNMGYACTACHLNLDPASKPHAEKAPAGTPQEQYLRRFNLSGTMQSGDTGSAMGNPLLGICVSCHGGYRPHLAGGYAVGCLDCHDEHGEGTRGGTNAMMIPETAKRTGFYVAPAPAFADKAGTEAVSYDTPRLDAGSDPYAAAPEDKLGFFRQDGPDGVCDTTECHGRYAPLGGWIGAEGNHSGGTRAPGDDCASCHRHNASAGGWHAP